MGVGCVYKLGNRRTELKRKTHNPQVYSHSGKISQV
jgi:hypothetical protein